MKRKTLIVALAVCLVAIMAFGTLAFFSAQDSVTNNFMIADSPNPDDDVFSVTVKETDPETGDTTDGNTYPDIKPGDELHKDPTITNTGRYDQYVRVSVTVTNAASWQKAMAKHELTKLSDIFGEFDESAWALAGTSADTVADTLTYTYYYVGGENAGVLKPGESVTMFKTVTIPSAFDTEDMTSLKSFSLIITAEAIQSDNMTKGETTYETLQNVFALYDAQVAKEAA